MKGITKIVSKLELSLASNKLEVPLEAEKPTFSMVMPAYNEEEVIEEVIEKVDCALKKTGLKYELIVVNDGSADETERRLMSYSYNNGHVKVLGYAKNMGKGHAIKTGFACAKGDTVVFMDSDLDINPGQISRYIEALKRADIVIASKWLPQSKVEMPFIRKILSYMFNLLVKLFTGIRVNDTQTGLKAVRRKALMSVFSKLSVKRFAFDVELLTISRLYNLKAVELPVTLKIKRGFSLREIWRMFIDLLGITYRLRLLKQYQRISK